MGFITKIKNLFVKKITTADVDDSRLISLLQKKGIKFGTTLEVKPNTVAVFVAKGKVADVFNEGVHKLELGYLPLLSRTLKLAKPDKKGRLPNKFDAELYLINLKQFEKQNFYSFNSVYIKDKKYKNVHVRLNGVFDFEIFGPIEFLEAMLTQYGILKDKIAKTEISNWVAELAVKKVQKNKPGVEQLHARASECFDGLLDYVNKELFDCGIKVLKIDVAETVFPKKVFKSVELEYTELNNASNASNNDVRQPEQNNVLNGSQNSFENNNQQNILTDNTQQAVLPNAGQQTVLTNDYQQQALPNNNQNFNQNNYQNVFAGNNQQNAVAETQYNNTPQTQQYEVGGYKQNDFTNTNNQTPDYLSSDYNTDIYANQIDDYADNQYLNHGGAQTVCGAEEEQPEIINTIGYKKCLNCGAFNSVKSEHCFNCKCKI